MLYRKMFRDIRQNKTQFLSILLMLFAGIFIFAGMSAEGEGMRHSSQKYYKETHLSDALVYKAGVTGEDVERLKKEPGIKDAELRLKMEAVMASDGDQTVSLNIVPEGKISKPVLLKGDAFDGSEEGAWVDQKFAEANDMKVGDEFEVRIEDQIIKTTIRGLIMQPEYIYAIQDDSQIFPDHKNYGYAFLPAAYFQNTFLDGQPVPYNQIQIRGNASQKELEQSIETLSGNEDGAVVMQKDYPGQNMFTEEIEQQKAMRYIFPAAFLAIALLTMVTTMTRVVVNQRLLIGTMKALGVSNRKIYVHYISYGIMLGILGSALGILTGAKALPALVYHFQQSFYTMPKWEPYIGIQVYLSAGVCIMACALSGYFVCRRALREEPAKLLRPVAPKKIKMNRLGQSHWWKNRSFKVQWNMRDVFRNKARSLITIFGVAGCAMLTVSAMGLKDTTKDMTDWMYRDIYRYQTKVILKEGAEETETTVLKEEKTADGSRQYIMDSSAQIKNGDKKESYPLEVLEEGKYIRFTDKNRKPVTLPDQGIVLTYKAAQKLNVKEGDAIQWKPYGDGGFSKGKVTKIIRQPMAQGMYMTQSAYEKSGYTMIPTAFYSNLDKDRFQEKDYQGVQSKKETQEAMDTSLEVMNIMIGILIGAAAFLGIVVLYNLGILSFTEKMRELATLEVLGFADGKIRGILALQNIWLTAAGILGGVPVGYALLSYMLRFMGDNLDMDAVVAAASYMLAVGGIFLLSCLVNLILGRNVRKIDMVSALKGVE